MSELLPCPFCGNETPEFERVGSPRQSCIVICGHCGARHESSDEGSRNGSSWNQRAAAQAAQPEAVSIKVLEIALDRLQYISDFFCDEAGGDDWHLKGVAIDALEEIQRVRASAPTPEPMSAPTAEPVAKVSENRPVLYGDEYATPPSAATPEPSDAERYQLVRRGQHWSVIDGIGNVLRGDDLDAAIDSIRATKGGKL